MSPGTYAGAERRPVSMLIPIGFRRHCPKKRWGNGSYHSHGFSQKVKSLIHRADRRRTRQALREGREDLPPASRFPWKFYW